AFGAFFEAFAFLGMLVSERPGGSVPPSVPARHGRKPEAEHVAAGAQAGGLPAAAPASVARCERLRPRAPAKCGRSPALRSCRFPAAGSAPAHAATRPARASL